MKKRRINKKRVALLIGILLLAVILILFFALRGGEDSKSSSKVKKVKTVDKIEGYDYSLAENETKYYKTLFKELKKLLESDDYDETEYAELVSKLFVADFYNLDNKISQSDIGGTQFVYKDFRDDFESIAKTTMYKQIESDVYGERNQELPKVVKVNTTATQTSFKYGDKTDDKAYSVAFEIEYENDLEYQSKGTITLIHNDKKLELAALE